MIGIAKWKKDKTFGNKAFSLAYKLGDIFQIVRKEGEFPLNLMNCTCASVRAIQ